MKATSQDLEKTMPLDLIQLTQKTKADKLCTIKSSKKDIFIPAKRTIQVNYRAKTKPVEL